MGTRLFGPKEIDGLLVPPGKAYTHLTDNLNLVCACPGKVFQVKSSKRISGCGLFG